MSSEFVDVELVECIKKQPQLRTGISSASEESLQPETDQIIDSVPRKPNDALHKATYDGSPLMSFLSNLHSNNIARVFIGIIWLV